MVGLCEGGNEPPGSLKASQLSLMLAGNEFQSLDRAIVKEDEYEEVRWDVRSLHGRSLDGSRCKYCNEIKTLVHVLGSCQHGELLRNSRHHNIRKLVAQALRSISFEVHEEVHCVASEGGGIRRADIVALDKTNSKGFILDPTVRFEMSQTQPSERTGNTVRYPFHGWSSMILA
ncbi:hypothetical protein ANN_03772 [Periplaneta americana]|uniref:Reverse transcriptase n=1 Tax=Periplaneta americana TaxID=6978 RepID=A0ABQ8U4F6_PERAM|nr:hypothetical protein ANN_03772 [Periplaneta americana]